MASSQKKSVLKKITGSVLGATGYQDLSVGAYAVINGRLKKIGRIASVSETGDYIIKLKGKYNKYKGPINVTLKDGNGDQVNYYFVRDGVDVASTGEDLPEDQNKIIMGGRRRVERVDFSVEPQATVAPAALQEPISVSATAGVAGGAGAGAGGGAGDIAVDSNAPTIIITMENPYVGPGQSTIVTFQLSAPATGFMDGVTPDTQITANSINPATGGPFDVRVVGGTLSGIHQIDASTWGAAFTADPALIDPVAPAASPVVLPKPSISVVAGAFTGEWDPNTNSFVAAPVAFVPAVPAIPAVPANPDLGIVGSPEIPAVPAVLASFPIRSAPATTEIIALAAAQRYLTITKLGVFETDAAGNPLPDAPIYGYRRDINGYAMLTVETGDPALPVTTHDWSTADWQVTIKSFPTQTTAFDTFTEDPNNPGNALHTPNYNAAVATLNFSGFDTPGDRIVVDMRGNFMGVEAFTQSQQVWNRGGVGQLLAKQFPMTRSGALVNGAKLGAVNTIQGRTTSNPTGTAISKGFQVARMLPSVLRTPSAHFSSFFVGKSQHLSTANNLLVVNAFPAFGSVRAIARFGDNIITGTSPTFRSNFNFNTSNRVALRTTGNLINAPVLASAPGSALGFKVGGHYTAAAINTFTPVSYILPQIPGQASFVG